MIELKIESLTIPSTSGVTHTNTSWQVSKTMSFEDESNLVLNLVESNVDLLEYDLDYSLFDNEVLFVRVMYHLSNDETVGWSQPLRVSKGHGYLHTELQYIMTPMSMYTISKSEIETIISDNVGFASNITTSYHKATSWYIYDSSGLLLWQREMDVDNLLSFKIPKEYVEILDNKKLITIKAVYIDNTGHKSYPGKVDIVKYVNNTLIEIPHTIVLFTTGINLVNLVFNYMADSVYSYELKNEYGEILITGVNQIVENINLSSVTFLENKDYKLIVSCEKINGGIITEDFILTAKKRTLNLVDTELEDSVVRVNVDDTIGENLKSISEENVYDEIPVFTSDNLVEFYRYVNDKYTISRFNGHLILPELTTTFINKAFSPYDDHLVILFKDDTGINIKTYQYIKNSIEFIEILNVTLSYYDTYDLLDKSIPSTMIQNDELLLNKKVGDDIIFYSINMFTGIETTIKTILNMNLDADNTIIYIGNNKVLILGTFNDTNVSYVYDMENDTISSVVLSNDITNDMLSNIRAFRINENNIRVIGTRTSDGSLMDTLVNIELNTWSSGNVLDPNDISISLLTNKNKLVLFK